MDHKRQRSLGIKLAEAGNAPKTVAAIRDGNSCFEDILKTAADEMGVEAMVSHILQNEPEWAYHTLLHLPDLGGHREALIEKVAESPDWSVETARRCVEDLDNRYQTAADKVAALGQTNGNISGFHFIDQAWYNCQFTMFWINDGKPYPQTAVPKSHWNDWKWSSELRGAGPSDTRPCTYFALPKDPKHPAAPLAPGNPVWLYMWVRAGKDFESQLQFTYDPNTTDIAYFTATGSTTVPSLSLTKVASPNAALAA